MNSWPVGRVHIIYRSNDNNDIINMTYKLAFRSHTNQSMGIIVWGKYTAEFIDNDKAKKFAWNLIKELDG